jgi:hypothetical protein
MNPEQVITFVKSGSIIAVRFSYQTPGMRAWFVKGATAMDADNAVRTFLPLNFGTKRLSHQRATMRLHITPKFQSHFKN